MARPTTPHDAQRNDPRELPHDDAVTMGTYAPHAANEGETGEWMQEVLPTEDRVSREHHDDHIPHGWHDFGAVGWIGATLMLIAFSLMVYGLVLPALGLREPWNAMPLR